MDFLLIVLVFLVMQAGVDLKPLHNDTWWTGWTSWCRSLNLPPQIATAMQLLVPALVAVAVLGLVSRSSVVEFVFLAILLLYSVGRCELVPWVRRYKEMFDRPDNDAHLGVCLAHFRLAAQAVDGFGDREARHRVVFERAVYSGFERLFVIFFWFFCGGIFFALLYRLARIEQDTSDANQSLGEERLWVDRVIWLLEWPVVRLVGLSLIAVGNTQAAMTNFVEWVKDTQNGAEKLLAERFRLASGAINPIYQAPSEEISPRDFDEILPMYSRMILLWLVVMGAVNWIG